MHKLTLIQSLTPPSSKPRPVVVLPPCQVARAQAPLQACLRPGMWLPGIRNLHSARESWKIDASVTEAMNSVVSGIQDMEATTELMDLHRVSRIVRSDILYQATCMIA